MRQKITLRPCFSANIPKTIAVVSEYHAMYVSFDVALEKNPKILDLAHEDLKSYGVSGGRESSFSTEQVLRMILVKATENFTWRELIIRVSESDFLRNFTRIGMGTIMSFSFLATAFKQMRTETWDAINNTLLEYAISKGKVTSTDLRVDSTVVETNIHYPTDSYLMWDVCRVGYRELSRFREMDARCPRFRFHLRKIKKLHTFVSTHAGKKTASTKRDVKKSLQLLVDRVSDLIEKIKLVQQLSLCWNCTDEQALQLQIIGEFMSKAQSIAKQSARAVSGEVVHASERIFSIFEDHTELLIRGKAQKPCEFGHMVTIAQTREKFITTYHVAEKSPHDSTMTNIVLEQHKTQFGQYPEKFAADKNYYKSMEDVQNWEMKIDVFSIGKKGRRNADETEREHSDEFRGMQKFRAGCEGSISVLKRGFGLKRLLSRSFNSFSAWVGTIVFCHNLVLLGGT